MNYLLDTNVISEPLKPRPNPKVLTWLAQTDEDSIFLSVMTFAEIRKGIEEISPGHRRSALTNWLDQELAPRFDRRILAVDLPIAAAWGEIMAQSKKQATNLSSIDALFAATAATYDLTLVTRNTKHFHHLAISLLNPWTLLVLN